MSAHDMNRIRTVNTTRLTAVVATLLLLIALCAACQPEAPTPAPSAGEQQPTVLEKATTPSPAAIESKPDKQAPSTKAASADDGKGIPIVSSSISLFLSGRHIHTIPVDDEAGRTVMMEAIFNCMIKSAAWPALELDALGDRITLEVKYEGDDQPTVFHVFEYNGRHCMQSHDMYTILNDEPHGPLHKLAMGYGLPDALTIRSGKNEIKATALPGGTAESKSPFTPKQMAAHIQYLQLDAEHAKTELTPFTPMAGGGKVFGWYRLYNDKFEELDFIRPSGLEPQTYLFKDREPGRYIVELETGEHCYFFGVVIP